MNQDISPTVESLVKKLDVATTALREIEEIVDTRYTDEYTVYRVWDVLMEYRDNLKNLH